MLLVNALVIIVLMIILNAVFAAYEMALASVSRSRLSYLEQNKRRGAAEALFMKDRMEASLAVVQVGITLVGSIAAATGGAGITEILNPYFEDRLRLSKPLAEFFSLIILVVPLSAITIVFAELIPKTFAIRNSERVVLAMSGGMKYFTFIAYPVVSTLENVVKGALRFIDKRVPQKQAAPDAQSSLHEFTAALSLARTARLIDAQQEKIVMSAAQLSLRQIKSIIVPAGDIRMIPLAASLSDALLQAHLDMHTRFPVCAIEHDPQSIQGYINFKDIMAALKINPQEPTIKGIVRPLRRFQEEMTISRVFECMIQEKIHIALVEDAQGTVTGMITLEDIIEEMVGEIEDEFDRLPGHLLPYGNQWLAGGAAPMSAVAKSLELTLPPHEGDLKLADWFERHWPRPLAGGENVTVHGLQITVRKIRRKKLSEAFVCKAA